MGPEDIAAKYRELGMTTGWSFQYTPNALMKTAKVAFIGLNPGGEKFEQSSWDKPHGNSYELGNFNKKKGTHDKLQKQIAALECLSHVSTGEVTFLVT